MYYETVKELKEKGQWANFYIAGKGLVEPIKALGDNAVGLELGVARAETSAYLLDNCPNIAKFYCVDPWTPYMDWNGMVTKEIIEGMRVAAYSNMSEYGNKVEIIRETSNKAADMIEDNSLDFIFIDGDHSFTAAYHDITVYWPKVKKGGLFAGHDTGMRSVDDAIAKFRQENNVQTPINIGINNIWYWTKE